MGQTQRRRALTTTYDSGHPAYRDESDTRQELARVIDVCTGCRRCVDLCGVFPEMIRLAASIPAGGAGMMTPDQQDQIFRLCHECGLCVPSCPHGRGRHPDDVDVLAAVGRWQEMRRANGLIGLWERLRLFWGRPARP